LDTLGRAACVFDPDKLEWVNSQHIKRSDPRGLIEPLQEILQDRGLPVPKPDYLESIIPLLQPRSATLLQMADQAAFFLLPDEQIDYGQEHLKKLSSPEIRQHLQQLRDRLAALPSFTQEALEEEIRRYIDEAGIRFKLLAQPIRLAITGRTASPGLFETMEVLGRKSTVNRLGRFLEVP
jgi:glutamyl-tRNA synthetase